MQLKRGKHGESNNESETGDLGCDPESATRGFSHSSSGITGVCPSPCPALTLSLSVYGCNVAEGCAQTQSEDRSVLSSSICSGQTLLMSRFWGCFFPFLTLSHQPRQGPLSHPHISRCGMELSKQYSPVEMSSSHLSNILRISSFFLPSQGYVR